MKVGDILLWVGRGNHVTMRDVTVTKVGRKWISLSNHARIDKTSLIADGGEYMPPGRCYLSKSEYEAEIALSRAWQKFRMDIGSMYQIPKNATVEGIANARKILQLDSEKGGTT